MIRTAAVRLWKRQVLGDHIDEFLLGLSWLARHRGSTLRDFAHGRGSRWRQTTCPYRHNRGGKVAMAL